MVLKCQTETVNLTSHLAIFYQSSTEGTNFRIMFICLTCVYRAGFVLCSTCVGLDVEKSPEVTLCSG